MVCYRKASSSFSVLCVYNTPSSSWIQSTSLCCPPFHTFVVLSSVVSYYCRPVVHHSIHFRPVVLFPSICPSSRALIIVLCLLVWAKCFSCLPFFFICFNIYLSVSCVFLPAFFSAMEYILVFCISKLNFKGLSFFFSILFYNVIASGSQRNVWSEHNIWWPLASVM